MTITKKKQYIIIVISTLLLLTIIILFNIFRGSSSSFTSNSGQFPINDKQALNLALIKAAQRCNTKKVDELLKQGADINYVDVDGISPLIWSLDKINSPGYPVDTAIFLLNKGANVNIKPKFALPALARAVAHNNVAITKLILDKGADVNMEFNGGHRKTPVMCSSLIFGAIYNCPDTIHLLIERGANIDYKNGIGRTALEQAQILNNHEAAIALKEEIEKHPQKSQ